MPITTFLADIEALLTSGTATEHTYRPALKNLFESVIAGCTAVNEPKRVDRYNAPDFVIQQGIAPLGHIEAKDIDTDLGTIIADSERDTPKTPNGKQLKRYRAALPNLLYTNGLEWHWFADGKPRLDAPICIATWDKRTHKLQHTTAAAPELQNLLQRFATHTAPMIGTPTDLARRLAHVALWLDEVITTILKDEGTQGTLHQQLAAFRDTLLPTITHEEFADMYAQTLVYGLFAARVTKSDTPTFTRFDAAHAIPKTNPFLRKMFQQIAAFDLDERMAWLVDDCAHLLQQTDMSEVLRDFGKATRQEDPIVHFYETFLAAYDPKTREMRGVYYTPEPVVSYIVRSVDHLLQTRFNKPDGLADDETLILDPATGTATFLHAVVQHIYTTLQAMGMADAWTAYVPEKLLPRVFGFELLMAPYTVAHLKLSMLLQQLGYDFGKDERLGIYLTNALDELPAGQTTLPFTSFIVDEGIQARAVKQNKPVMVVLGNPPYSYESVNTGAWISTLVRDYYQVDGHPLGERNPKGLQDDYVKFIRFGQWRINQTGEGILAFISNNGYLDNPTFRGMRESLLRDFDTIYMLNLHGNSRKKERTPDGSPDDNVFDIQQGVAIGIFVKQRSSTSERATIFYADIWGHRTKKYTHLSTEDITTTAWQTVHPTSPWYLFVPQDTTRTTEYEQGWKVTDILLVSSAGIVTGKDRLTICFDRTEARALATSQHISPDVVAPLLYRPFDHRWIIYDPTHLERSRSQIMHHILGKDTVCMLFARSTAPGKPFSHTFCMTSGTIARSFPDVACIAHFSPLYLYPNGAFPEMLFEHENGRRPNLSAAFITDIEQRLGLSFIPGGTGNLETTIGTEDIFHYIYAIFHSPTYRSRYAEFLKIDFPRVPITSDTALFTTLAAYGAQLVDLHLLRLPGSGGVGGAGGAAVLSKPTQHGIGQHNVTSSPIDKITYNAQQQRVVIGTGMYFEGVEPDTWAMQIGGYQPLQKWLKDRKGRTLSFDDARHYMRMVLALRETRRLMGEIDAAVPWPVG